MDWQTIIVTLIIIAAAAYVARRGRSRLRSFVTNKSSGGASGCGSCGEPKISAPRAVVQINRPKPTARRSESQNRLR